MIIYKNNKISCIYLAIYEPKWARDRVLLRGLEQNGVRVKHIVSEAPSLKKYFSIFKRFWQVRNECDFVLVGYLSNVLVPFAAFISKKPVVWNALNAMYEGTVLDRGKYGVFSPRRYLIWCVDFAAFHAAGVVFVETKAQKRFLQKLFHVRGEKLVVLYTGADDSQFYTDESVKKENTFTAVFRGWFLPATGIELLLEAALILRGENIRFRLIGRGPLTNKVSAFIKENKLKNVELITVFLPDEELRKKILSSHVMLGALADHPRMERTIQNKTFEALALGMPHITRDSQSNRELLRDRVHCFFVKPGDARDVARRILELKKHPEKGRSIAAEGRRLYERRLTAKVLGREALDILRQCFKA